MTQILDDATSNILVACLGICGSITLFIKPSVRVNERPVLAAHLLDLGMITSFCASGCLRLFSTYVPYWFFVLLGYENLSTVSDLLSTPTLTFITLIVTLSLSSITAICWIPNFLATHSSIPPHRSSPNSAKTMRPRTVSMLLFSASLGCHLSTELSSSLFRTALLGALFTHAPWLHAHPFLSLSPQEVRHHVLPSELPRIIVAYNVALSKVFLLPIGLGVLAFIMFGVLMFSTADRRKGSLDVAEGMRKIRDQKKTCVVGDEKC